MKKSSHPSIYQGLIAKLKMVLLVRHSWGMESHWCTALTSGARGTLHFNKYLFTTVRKKVLNACDVLLTLNTSSLLMIIGYVNIGN